MQECCEKGEFALRHENEEFQYWNEGGMAQIYSPDPVLCNAVHSQYFGSLTTERAVVVRVKGKFGRDQLKLTIFLRFKYV